jgi:hypothetical protein
VDPINLSPRQRARRQKYENRRLGVNLRRRIIEALNGNKKSAKTMELVGCSINFLRYHLETMFKPGMSWSNYGGWHIDHIRPCASFDLADPEQQRECFNYSNLQPLWGRENSGKGARPERETGWLERGLYVLVNTLRDTNETEQFKNCKRIQ